MEPFLNAKKISSQVVAETPAVDESQFKTTESTIKAVKTQLNVGAQAAGVISDKSSHVTIMEKKVDNLRISKRKRIPHEKIKNLEICQ